MKFINVLIFFSMMVGSIYAQTSLAINLPDSLSFVPNNGFNLRSMPVNLPSSSKILSQDFSFEMITGGFLNIFLSDRSFNTIKPFSLRDYNPTSVSDFNSYIYRNYFLIDKQSVINDW